jgi:hypothetical protein
LTSTSPKHPFFPGHYQSSPCSLNLMCHKTSTPPPHSLPSSGTSPFILLCEGFVGIGVPIGTDVDRDVKIHISRRSVLSSFRSLTDFTRSCNMCGERTLQTLIQSRCIISDSRSCSPYTGTPFRYYNRSWPSRAALSTSASADHITSSLLLSIRPCVLKWGTSNPKKKMSLTGFYGTCRVPG